MRTRSRTSLFKPYVATATAAGVAAAVAAAMAGRPTLTDTAPHAGFFVLWALVVAAELLPIRVCRPHGVDYITISSGFAFAVLLLYGPAAAIVTYSSASAVGDLANRLSIPKVAFNAGQYALSVGAGALALALTGDVAPIEARTSELPTMMAAAGAMFVANHVLVAVYLGLRSSTTAWSHVRADFGFRMWTGSFQFALAPLIIASAGPLSVLGLLPMLAIYLGGRHAAAAHHRAAHDGLTDLPNRAGLNDLLEESVRHASPRHPVWVLMLGLDEFKSVNDTLGHAIGGELLRQVAQRLTGVLRRPDVVARLGGDEFAVVVHDADEASAVRVARRLLEALDSPAELGEGLLLNVQGRIGLACSGGSDEPDELLRRADIALYDAKATRRRWARYTGQHFRRARDHLALARSLHDDLEAKRVHVHFQVKVPVSGGPPIGVEALARWWHPRMGVVDPAAFIAVAEETGMIKRLTVAVLDRALQQCGEWQTRHPDLRLAVNLSPKSLVDCSLPDTIGELLARHRVRGDTLQLEITESAYLAGVGRASEVVQELCAMGVTLAIDDFGTGFSSLAQLQQLPVQEIKIDRSFVQAMHDNRQAAAIVRSTVSLARSLDLSVTAEGVETEAVAETLRGYGCDYAQGFLFGRPGPGHSIEPLLGAAVPSEPRLELCC